MMKRILPALALGMMMVSSTACFAEGAVAVGGDRYGMAYNQHSGRAAEERAIEYCDHRDCHVVLRFDGECASYASDERGAKGWAKGEREEHAERHAVEQCREHSNHPGACEVRMTKCDQR